MAVLSPIGASNKQSDATNLVGIGGLMSFGVYNAKELSKDSYSWNDRFKKNMIAMHALAIAVGVTESMFGKIPFSKNVSVIPEKEGMHLAFNMNI